MSKNVQDHILYTMYRVSPCTYGLLIFVLIFLMSFTKIAASNQKSIVSPSVVVSAAIGIPKMTLWGYGPPNSNIQLLGVGVDQNTTSDGSGYYSFDIIYLLDANSYPEMCVTAIDSQNIATPPTCIPPVSAGNYFYNVGPVVLPPTISIGSSETYNNSQVSAQGQAIPNSDIEIKLARKNLTYFVPNYKIESDSKGNYSFNMPTSESEIWRVFTVADFQGLMSPKSNTLKFEAMKGSTIVTRGILAFLLSFLSWPRILILILLLLIITIVTISLARRKSKISKRIKSAHRQSGS